MPSLVVIHPFQLPAGNQVKPHLQQQFESKAEYTNTQQDVTFR
jgi:hypothetical protein